MAQVEAAATARCWPWRATRTAPRAARAQAAPTFLRQRGRAREQRDPEEECGVRVAARPRLSGGQVRELPFWGDCYSAELKPPA